MKIFDLGMLRPPGGEAATFHGFEHEVDVSFFVVQFSPGRGPEKHRHPYAETFILVDGEIEAIVDSKSHTIGPGKIAIVPPCAWHEFKNCSDRPLQMINIHPVEKMITEWA